MPQMRTKKQLEQKRKDDRRQELIKKAGTKGVRILAKTALGATPPGMLISALKAIGKKLPKKKKRPEAKTGPRPKKPGLKKKVQKAVPGGPFKPENKKNPVPGGPYIPKKGPRYMKPMKKRKK